MASEFPSLLDFNATDDFNANALDGLTLGSPVMLPHQLDHLPSAPVDMGGYMLAPSLNTKTSAMSLASTSSYSMGSMEQPMAPTMHEFQSPADLSNSTITPAMPQFRPPSPANSDPGDGGHRFPDHRLFSSPSMPALNARFTRRKASRAVSYRDFNFDGDSDDDYEMDADGDYEYDDDQEDGAAARGRKRARRVAGDGDVSDGSAASGSRMRSIGAGGRKVSSARRGPLDPKARRSKNKKRHLCTRPGCTSSFTRITDMERHLASVHRAVDSNVNRCTFCQKQFSREDAVLRHENDSCPQRPKKKAVEKWI